MSTHDNDPRRPGPHDGDRPNQAGPTGRPGHDGQPNQHGYPGQSGYDGQPGYSGQSNQPGYSGQPGQPGYPGQQAQPGQPGQPQIVYMQEPKKPLYKRPGCLIPLVLAIIAIVIVGGCMALFGSAVNEVDQQMNAEHTITYSIEGDATDAMVTYNVDETNTAQENGVTGGWSKEVTVKGIFGGYISASNGIYDTGSITCRISANGKTLSENTASGEFASATCSADSTAIAEAYE
ncbi:MmpS family transport accessory protein [uncultured Corynebacterium sp.]|uniref:MmpS family transport accessory protein n=1 Tax=uncultured Corynebacterium sp. TaxID=159447 RepID=UPI0025D6CA85|nr:MmpS family transport accessory protein [uncultured Corynebacterium sp.]